MISIEEFENKYLSFDSEEITPFYLSKSKKDKLTDIITNTYNHVSEDVRFNQEDSENVRKSILNCIDYDIEPLIPLVSKEIIETKEKLDRLFAEYLQLKLKANILLDKYRKIKGC